MGPKGRVTLPRVALDTNVVVSALLFGRGRLAWLREKWQASVFVPVVDHDTVDELIRVLGYPKFKLTRLEQEALLGDFLPYAEAVTTHVTPTKLPAMRDPDDVMFLALAKRARVDALITGDADLQAVRGQLDRVLILTAQEFHEWLAAR